MRDSRLSEGDGPVVDEELLNARIVDEGAENTWAPGAVDKCQARFRDQLAAYRDLHLGSDIDSIDDDRVKRLCQVLTNYGFRTVDSCEGHGERLPSIYFVCEDTALLKDLAFIINHGSRYKRFNWRVDIESGYPPLNAGAPLNFRLIPTADFEAFDLSRDYDDLMRDLDIIALCIMDYFKEKGDEGIS